MDMIDCKSCQGTGEVIQTHDIKPAMNVPELPACPNCKGTGKVPAPAAKS